MPIIHSAASAEVVKCGPATGYDYYVEGKLLEDFGESSGWTDAAYSKGFLIDINRDDLDKSVVMFQGAEGMTSTAEQKTPITAIYSSSEAVSFLVLSTNFNSMQHDIYTLYSHGDKSTLIVQSNRFGSQLPKSGIVVSKCEELKRKN